jgi:hypothetical protein
VAPWRFDVPAVRSGVAAAEDHDALVRRHELLLDRIAT